MSFTEIFAWGFGLSLVLYFLGWSFGCALDLFFVDSSDSLSWDRSDDQNPWFLGFVAQAGFFNIQKEVFYVEIFQKSWRGYVSGRKQR